MNFVAIDFETANAQRESACAVGLAEVQEGEVIDHFSALIRPPNLDFNPRNIAIHGIQPRDVEKQNDFTGLWPRLSVRIAGKILVAHNALFDIGVLCACLRLYGLESGPMKYACTLAMSRQLVPGLPNHRLPTLALLFGIDLYHHDACCDAVACARLAVILGRIAGNGLESFVCDVPEGQRMPGYDNAHQDYYAESIQSQIDSCTILPVARPDGRFAGLGFAFTGKLAYLSREEAESVVRAFGGHASNNVSKKTNCVVVGDQVLSCFERTGATTGKLARARSLQEAGVNLKILSESEFLKLIV